MTDTDKIRFLAGLAGWTPYDHPCYDPGCCWKGLFQKDGLIGQADYPHSLDAIARDLLPLLRERGWEHSLTWDGAVYRFRIWDLEAWPPLVGDAIHPDSPARAAFEAIYEALRGGEE